MSRRTVQQAAAVLGIAAAGALAGCRTVIRDGYGQSYLRSKDNWVFRRRYPAVDRLFNGFDYGHAIVYERLLQERKAARVLDGPDLDFITGDLLVHPPPVPLVEQAIGPHYANLVPEVLSMFEWAHMLHRQLYDICADISLDEPTRDARIAAALRYYGSRRDLALSSTPKSMNLMEGQPYSLVFRRTAPQFNRLLWSYHWLQMALYDGLLADRAAPAQDANVQRIVARFWELVKGDPASPPTIMPMSAAVAPRFSERYPQAAIIFDNLHALHDVVADILASPDVPRAGKRDAVIAAARAYRDDATETTSRAAWAEMSMTMGVDAMGGPALAAPHGP